MSRQEAGRGERLVEIYRKMFDAKPADTPELLESAFRLRYQVYCVENSFENPADHPNGLETDRFDRHSRHALLMHRLTGLVVGTTRLVLPRLGPVAGRLPIFDACPEAAELLPPATTAEFSRFAISKHFRRRLGDDLYGRAYDRQELHNDGRRIIPHITLGLMAVALQLAGDYRIDHVAAIMEPALLRLLARFGIRFNPLGPIIDYHGWRQPCYARIDDLLAEVESERHDIWEVITDCGRSWTVSRGRNRARGASDVPELVD